MDGRRLRGLFTLAFVCALGLVLMGGGVARAGGSTVIDASTCDQTDLQNAINSGDVTFSADCTIHLTSALDLSNGPSTIDGSGYNVVLDGQNTVRVFSQTNDGSNDYSLIHLTLENGNSGSSASGGAVEITSNGTLTLTDATFIDNQASYNGGAVDALGGTVVASDSTFTGNTAGAHSRYGGAINAANMTLTGSTFTGNSASLGGAVVLQGGTGTLSGDTFSGNGTTFGGLGGAFVDYFGSSTVTGSTFSGNSSGDFGGGGAVYSQAATDTFTNDTFSGNSVGYGGIGAVFFTHADPVTLTNDTIANNSGDAAIYSNADTVAIDHTLFSGNEGDCTGTNGGAFADNGYNLTDTDGSACAFSTDNNDLLSTAANLAPLGDYGGFAQTRALQATSPAAARDTGTTCSPTTDETGAPRPSGHCSIGAVQFDGAHQWITTCNETTLDAAVAAAVATNSPSTIKFGCDGTIGLTSTINVPSGGGSVDVTLDGHGHAVTLDGGGSVLLFELGNAAFAIDGLTLDNANGVFHGSGTGLTIDHSTIKNTVNAAVVNVDGPVTATNSTFSNNSADQLGTVFSGSNQSATFTNDTFVGNTDYENYGNDAALVTNTGTVTLEDDLFNGNGNAASTGTPTNCFVTGGGAFIDNGFNLADGGPDGGGCGFGGGGSNDILTDTPNLGPLADNGGPTQTFALTDQSPVGAVDTHADCGLSTDQRGTSRPTAHCSIGAYQYDATNQTISTSTCDEPNFDGAVAIAAAEGAPATVTFASDCTIDLTSAVTLPDGADVTIDGTGHNVVLDGQGSTRIFDDEAPTGSLTLDHLTLRNGNAGWGGTGGAIQFLPSGTLTIADSTLSDNAVGDFGGGGAVYASNFAISGSTFRGNTIGQWGDGAGVMLVGGPTWLGTGSLSDDTFSSNSIGFEGGGGAFYDSGGTTTITGTTFDGNSTGSYGQGGAIFGQYSTDTITNSTFSGNSAASGKGSAIAVLGYSLSLVSDTLVGNTGADAAIHDLTDGGFQTVEISSTLFAGNGTDCSLPATADDGYNLGEDISCLTGGTPGDIVTSSPNLMPLGNYGGPTDTIALQATSPAIDAGACAAPDDQRGVSRPQGARCDIGAYEATTAPTTVLAVSPYSPNGRNGWYTTAPQVTLTPNATATTDYSVNDASCQEDATGACTAYSSPFALPDGTDTLTYFSHNGGFEGARTSSAIKVDTTAPSSSIDLHGYTAGSWTNQDVTFSLSATDATSGVAHSYFKVDSGSTTNYSSPVTVNAEGKHSVTYRSVDVAGNAETGQTASIKIDKTAPLLSGAPTTSPNANGWYRGNVTVKWTCSDALSGIASCPANSTVSTEGSSQTASASDTDNAGNSTNGSSSAVKIDKTAPTTTGALSTSGYHSGLTYEGPVTLTLTPADVLSGVDKTYYTVDGGSTLTYSTPVSLDTGGSHTFRYWSTDLAGNQQATQVLSFTLLHKPGAPSLGSVTRGVRSLGVSWTAPSDTGGGSLTGYAVTYVNQSTSASVTKSVGAATTSMTLAGLADGTSYSVSVQATNAVGTGTASSSQVASTYAMPDAPGSFVAGLADSGASLSWQPGASDGGTPVTSYALTITSSGGSSSQSFNPATVCTPSGCSADLSGLTNGVAYTLKLWSVNAAGKSLSYALANVKPFAKPSSPTSVDATGGIGKAVVTWVASSYTGGGVASYTITLTGGASPVVKSFSAGTACSADPCTATVNGLANGTTYTITVKAVNPAGASDPSIYTQATTDSAPGLPNGFTAVPGSGSADLSWQAPTHNGGSAITGYRLRVFNGSSLLDTVTINCTTFNCYYTYSGLTSGTKYTLSLNAINGVGSGPSASLYVTPS